MFVLLILALLAIEDGPVSFTPQEIQKIQNHLLPPLPEDPTNRYADDPNAAHLGQALFFETRFSRNGEVACASCHNPARAFTDGTPLSTGLAQVQRHTPTVLNSAYQRWLFWDGRTDSLWAQALAPFEEDREFGGSRLEILHMIHRDSALRQAYEQVFGALPPLAERDRFPEMAMPSPHQPEDLRHQAWQMMAHADRLLVERAFVNLGKAIAAYERRLISRDSPFDRFALALTKEEPSDLNALSPAQQRGLKLFIGKAGCRNCHAGPNFSDYEFHNTGVPPLQGSLPRDAGRYEGIPQLLANPFRADGAYSDEPSGPAAQRLRAIHKLSDQWGQFKTPTLRDIAETAPYMHQGQMKSLDEVLRFYNTLERQVRLGHHQDPLLQPLGLEDAEIADLIEFLKALSGAPLAPELLQQPKLETLP